MLVNKIYSRVNPKRLLHTIANANAIRGDRVDISEPQEFLQASIIALPAHKQVAPHVHDQRSLNSAAATITQECWVVMRGRIHVRLFDDDLQLLHEEALSTGYLLVSYGGGHGLQCLDEDAVILEFKNGPYLGRDFHTFS